MKSTIDDVVDLERYPIASDGAARQAVVDACREQLRKNGVALLPGFVNPRAVASMAKEAARQSGDAFLCDDTHNVYLNDAATFQDAHVGAAQLRTVVGSIAYDLLDRESSLRQLYEWEPLVAFVRDVLAASDLYRLADPLGACSINVFRPGDFHGWHFDETEVTTTIMLQEADDGGFFEYVPHIRRADGSEADAIAAIIGGDESRVQRLAFRTGTMSIFAGHVSLHRVTEVLGAHPRFVAVLAFNSKPGVMNSDEVRQLFWGRTS